MRTRCLAVVIAGILGCLAIPAHAEPRTEIAAKARAAMASYDAIDYDNARRLLNQALAAAKKAKLDKDPVVARVYLDLGIVQLAGADQDGAKLSLLSAAQIDPKISIDPAYKSAELVRLLDDAKAAAGAIEGGGDDASAECKAVRGVQHTLIETGRRGAAQPVEALIGGELSPARVAVMYRPEGAIDFTEARLTRQAGCRYTGAIPGAAMHGSLVHYYIVAYDANNKVLAAKGSSGAPNILELGPSAGRREPEDPLGGDRPEGGSDVTSVSSRAVTSGKGSSIVLSLSAGTGFGYVTGETEGGNQVQTCCVGTSLIVLTPELAYAINRKLSIGVAARLGLPIGANIDGHATIAPSGLLRIHYALSASGDGLRLTGELGAGVLRNTIKVDATDPGTAGMDTDVVAQGPLLVGAGLGYTRHLGGPVMFLAELDAIAGLAVADKLGSAIHLNTGISADVSLGFAVGF